MSWNACRVALETHLLTLPGLDAALVAWPNRVFPPDGVSITDKIYYRVALIPAQSWAPYGSNARRFKGIFQVTPCAPSGKGPLPLTQAVDAICAHFALQVLTQDGQTIATSTPTPGPFMQDGDRVQAPVSIPFETR